ncbi:MAG TPA: serine/threonine-protein kinase, partial [Pirellulaceae bacterium]|nr:serine/threonine-protein kinase [Pirellulaceae bacterium]
MSIEESRHPSGDSEADLHVAANLFDLPTEIPPNAAQDASNHADVHSPPANPTAIAKSSPPDWYSGDEVTGYATPLPLTENDVELVDGLAKPPQRLADGGGRSVCDDWIGRRVGIDGRYHVVSHIGRGGMADVFLATDSRRHDAFVALKTPDRDLLPIDEIRRRFLREHQALVKVEHPHVCRVLDTGEHDDLPFVVLPYLGGGHLKQRFGTAESLTLERRPLELLAWLKPLAVALDFVHAKDYLHRDVKPENILFDSHGHVYLGDFGVVRTLAEPSYKDDLNLTRFNARIGTPGYMAPELGTGRKVDGRADLYSLAAVVYWFLTLERAFVGATPEAVRLAQVATLPRPAHLVNPALPSAVSTVLARGLAVDPADRPKTCEEFHDEIAAALRQTAVHSRRPSPRRRTPLRVWAVVLSLSALGLISFNGRRVAEFCRRLMPLRSPATAAADSSAASGPAATTEVAVTADGTPRNSDASTDSASASTDDASAAPSEQARSATTPATSAASPTGDAGVTPSDERSAQLDRVAERRYQNALSYLRYDQPAAALAELDEAIPRSPGVARYYIARAAARRQLASYNAALVDYGHALRIEASAEVHAERALCHLLAGDPQSGADDFEKAMRMAPREPRYVAGRGLAMARQRRWQNAIDDYTRAIELTTEATHSSNTAKSSRVNETQGDAAGNRDFVDSSLAEWHYARAICHSRLARHDEALGDLSTAIRLAPSERRYLAERAALHELRGDEAAARADRKSLERESLGGEVGGE